MATAQTPRTPSVGSHVLVSGGNRVGTVKALVTDDRGKETVGMVVESGRLRKHARLVSLEAVKWVNPDSVVLELTRRAYEALPEYTAPSATPAAGARHGHEHGSAAG